MADGVLTRESPFSFAETLERLERAIVARGLTIFARIDHRAGARAAGLDMHEATVLVFGSPTGGTPSFGIPEQLPSVAETVADDALA